MNKEQFIKIRESIIKLREELGTRKILFILYSFCALLIVFILIVAYRPLALKLGNAQRKLDSLQTQLLAQRDNIAAFKKVDLKGRIMQQKELSQAIDEITGKGRTLGVKFISITPKELQKQAPGNFKALPTTFQMECDYKSLGQFLVYLEEFPRTTAEVKNLSVRPREKLLPKLNIEVLVDLYLEEKDAKE
ncbi:MAG: type 4a pilus biogenesis protein PilO [Candidatus Omnitrophica bacterium]|nr:type 4a pilus biogenesis protein PilO [Candidatus Omnitrophota bacterium]